MWTKRTCCANRASPPATSWAMPPPRYSCVAKQCPRCCSPRAKASIRGCRPATGARSGPVSWRSCNRVSIASSRGSRASCNSRSTVKPFCCKPTTARECSPVRRGECPSATIRSRFASGPAARIHRRSSSSSGRRRPSPASRCRRTPSATCPAMATMPRRTTHFSGAACRRRARLRGVSSAVRASAAFLAIAGPRGTEAFSRRHAAAGGLDLSMAR